MEREAPDPYHWYSFEESKLRCNRCGEIVQAEVADLHLLVCKGDKDE